MGDVSPVRAADLPSSRSFADVLYTPLPPLTRVVFRGEPEAQRPLAAACQCAMPAPLRATTHAGTALLWQGPDEILILSDEEGHALSSRIALAVGALPHACVDISHRNVGFSLKGERVTTLLASAVMLDLDERHFPVGMVTRTMFAKADIVLWRREPNQFQIDAWRSFAPYVIAMLAEGARGL